jgi:competence protein ComEC
LSGRDSFAVKEWLAADADERTPKDLGLKKGVACDAVGCIGKLRDGRLVSMALSVEAFAEDCASAAVVLSPRVAPSPNCVATLIDRDAWRTFGAITLRWTGDQFERTVTHTPGHERPWTQNPVPAAAPAGSVTPTTRPSSADSTPRAEDLDAGDQ